VAPSVVLVTGVSRFLGGHLAARLAADPSIGRVLGVDTAPPGPDLRSRMGRVEFVRADIRNPLIAKVIARADVDTVVHAALSPDPSGTWGSATKEMSVLGTMQLLAACQKASTVRRVVLESTTAVYGASPLDPALFDETMTPNDLPTSGYARDATEIEGYLRGFSRRRPDVSTTVLRFASLVGPRIDTVVTRYFALPVVPTVLGYDARLQLLHEEDALAVLERAVARDDLPDVVNVAADGVLLLSQAIRRAGRVPLPVPPPAVGVVGRVLAGARIASFSPEQLRLLDFGRVVDTTRLRTAFGFTPRWTTVQAFDDFVRGRALRPVIAHERVEEAERLVDRGVHAAARLLAGLGART
jgi:UDP-glucose 4-epimerase